MSRFWSERTRHISPYIPGEQPRDKKYIKLNTNENPYPPSPKVLMAIQTAADSDLRLYPDPTCLHLRQVIADYFRLTVDQVFVGNGSDEILAFCFPAFFNPGDVICYPDITYSFYPVYARLFQLQPQTVPLDDNFDIPLDTFPANAGLVFPNPNAPTGRLVSLQDIASLLDRCRQKIVILDEAYIDFGGESAAVLLEKYPNLLVVHTLSKSRSLAGLRLGYALGQADLIEGLERIKNSFNSYTLDRLAIAGGIAAIEDELYFQQTREKVMVSRAVTTAALHRLGFHVLDSAANFIFVSHPTIKASDLFVTLKQQGVLVRYFNQPRIDNWLRITIGTDDEMQRFIEILTEIIQQWSNLRPAVF